MCIYIYIYIYIHIYIIKQTGIIAFHSWRRGRCSGQQMSSMYFNAATLCNEYIILA